MPARSRYGTVAVTLHWVVALGILVQIVMGLGMAHLAIPIGLKFELYQLHKSIGITVLFAVVLRVLWRLTHTPPGLPEAMPALERRAATGAHLALYGFMLGLPLTGWALVSVSPYNIPTVLFGLIPWPDLPVLSTMPDKNTADAVAGFIHSRLAWGLAALVGLHVLAALRHQFVLRDGILRRMLPFLKA
ncbi:MAG TPA: cytochrome b [Acidocella sp.]|nr:cytochrome b [Acidocella sp.]